MEVAGGVVVGLLAAVSFLIIAAQEATEVQERQLERQSDHHIHWYVCWLHGAQLRLTACHLCPGLRPWGELSSPELLGLRTLLCVSYPSFVHR